MIISLSCLACLPGLGKIQDSRGLYCSLFNSTLLLFMFTCLAPISTVDFSLKVTLFTLFFMSFRLLHEAFPRFFFLKKKKLRPLLGNGLQININLFDEEDPC